MEKLVQKGKKAIRTLIVESLHETIHSVGLIKSNKKTEKVINKSARRISELVAAQMKKELKKIKSVKEKAPKEPKAKKVKKVKKVKKLKEPELETA